MDAYPANTKHLYNVGPTSKTLGRRSTNVLCFLGRDVLDTHIDHGHMIDLYTICGATIFLTYTHVHEFMEKLYYFCPASKYNIIAKTPHSLLSQNPNSSFKLSDRSPNLSLYSNMLYFIPCNKVRALIRHGI